MARVPKSAQEARETHWKLSNDTVIEVLLVMASWHNSMGFLAVIPFTASCFLLHVIRPQSRHATIMILHSEHDGMEGFSFCPGFPDRCRQCLRLLRYSS